MLATHHVSRETGLPQSSVVVVTELSVGWVDPRVGLGWAGSGMGRKFVFLVGWVGLGHGSEMTDVRKIHVVYIGNLVSSIDWQIRFVKTCGCLHCYDVH